MISPYLSCSNTGHTDRGVGLDTSLSSSLVAFLKKRKKWWLTPMIFIFTIVFALLYIAQFFNY